MKIQTDEEPDIRTWVIRAKNGNEAAFEVIYRQYANKILRFCYFKTSNKDLAADMTHDIFIKVWKNLSSVEPEKFNAWIYTIARNKVIDYYRTKKVHAQLNEQITDSGAKDLYEVAHKKHEFEKISGLLKRMKDDYRDIVLLRIMQELSVEEVADVLKISKSNVRVKTHRALKKLQSLYKSNYAGV